MSADKLGTELDAQQRSDRLARFVTKLTPEPARPEDKLAPAGERLESSLGTAR